MVLRLKYFENNITTSWKTLRTESNLCDVTLACGDGEIRAHKLILSSSSSVFKQIFSKNFNQHQYIYFKGVQYSQILAFLDYIYLGEVSLDQKDVNGFLEILEEFKIGKEYIDKQISDV